MSSKEDMIPKLRPGDRIKADDWNRIVTQLGNVTNLGDDLPGASTGAGRMIAAPRRSAREPDVVLIRNDTGGDLTVDHPVVGIGDTIVLPGDPDIQPGASEDIQFQWPIAFAGETPVEDDHFRKFAILDGPVLAGKYQTGIISGSAWVKIKVDDTSHKSADIEEGEVDQLITNDGGAAYILWKEAGAQVDDIVWANVRLGNAGGSVTVLGPCTTYTPSEDLDDTNFSVDFGGGCLGPSRYAAIYISTIGATALTVVIEQETGLLFSSDTFTHGCRIVTKTLEIEFEVTSLDIGGVELRFMESGSPIAIYQNTMYRWVPLLGGYLQMVDAPCDCGTFPFDVCLSVPTR